MTTRRELRAVSTKAGEHNGSPATVDPSQLFGRIDRFLGIVTFLSQLALGFLKYNIDLFATFGDVLDFSFEKHQVIIHLLRVGVDHVER